ncbi:hypothetical protein FB192DRAFT_1454682 [Mucor lusitanicus]|uniref:Choice-of-anchor A domain-containing protein n=1 Tax=Mucor circinelloides f. lusitanicus TaxID=29924 RepID=A0A8H4BUI2_MUCCL|nr:hypothetical protein FB192DRAFT_1454682 [Mucor lusitanicus]
MVRSLSLAVAALLVSSSFAAQVSIVQRFGGYLFPRAVETDLDDCRETNGYENDILTRFTGIFFGDFYTGGGTDILGGLAVQGNMHAPNYVVNANHGADCSDPDSFNSYGLVVGGIVDTFNTHVHGNAFLNSGGTIEEVLELDVGCFVTDQLGTGNFDFDVVRQMSIKSNQDFASLQPTIVLEPDGSLTELREGQLANYEIITFHSCNGIPCSAYPDIESDPSAILFGQGNWNGIQGSEIDPDKTYVLNIPVRNGDTIEIDGNNPTLGFNPCKLIYNFYPVDENNNYVPDGEFTLIRRTANQFGGFTLAPRGHIVDGSVGNFSGNLIGLDYTWENLNAGVEIHDYTAAGGDCDQYLGCVPVHVTSDPPTVSIPSTITSTRTRTRTRTWSSTDSLTSTSETTTVTYSPAPEPSDGIITSEYSPCPADATETTTSVTTTTTSVDNLTETVTVIEPDVTGTTTLTEGILTLTESGTTITTTIKATKTRTYVLIRPTIAIEYTCTNTESICISETEIVGEECTKDHDHHHDKDKDHGHYHKDDEDDEDDDKWEKDDDEKWDKDDKDDEDDEDDKEKWHKDDDEDEDEDDDDDKHWDDKKDKNY